MKELLELEPNECRYAMNEGGPYLFCAETRMAGSSYCFEHHRICTRIAMDHPRSQRAIALQSALKQEVTRQLKSENRSIAS